MDMVSPKAYIRKDTAALIKAKLPGDFPTTVSRFYSALNEERQGLTEFYTGEYLSTHYLLRLRPVTTDCYRQQATLFCARAIYADSSYREFVGQLAEFLFDEYTNMMSLEFIVPAEHADPTTENSQLMRTLYPLHNKKAYLDGERIIFERGFFGSRRFAFVPFHRALTWLLFDADRLVEIYFTPMNRKISAADDPFTYFILRRFDLLSENGSVNASKLEPYLIKQKEYFKDHENILSVIQQIEAYFKGEVQEIHCDYVFPKGTEFQEKVWHELMKIPYGSTRTYEQVAEAVAKSAGRGASYSRAVGAACGANPLAIIIPCHRVIGKNRDLVGFSGGVETKAKLLDLEILNYSA